MRLEVQPETYPLARAFTISRGAKTEAGIVTVTAEADGCRGRGDCVPYPRYGETQDSVIDQIAALPEGVDRGDVQRLMLPGAARNAVDCALWDLEAKRIGRPVWEMAGLVPPVPIVTAFTLSLDTPEAMRDQAARNSGRPLLKIKLGGEGDIARLEAVRQGAPKPRIIVDANEAWTADFYTEIAPVLLGLGVAMVEQPFPAGHDAALGELERPVPVCADESCHDRDSLAALAGRYDMINIKLDKTGGLTEALLLRDAARAAGFGIMVGCMVSTSLSIAPAVLVAQGADIVDLDGPLLLARDRDHPLLYDGAGVHPAAPELWG